MLLRKALVLTTYVLSTFASHHLHQDDSVSDWGTLQNLLDSIDSTVLHGVLHQLSPKFKDGVFSKDRSAIEHVHSENPIVASKLVHIALKRQAANATTTVSPAKTSQQAQISSELSSQIHASSVPKDTTVQVAPSQPPDATPISTGDGFVVYSTVGGGLVTKTSQAIGVKFTPSTSTHLAYTTLPNGQVQTQTSVVVVNAPVTETGGETGAAGAAATSSSPGLQNIAAAGLQASGVLQAVVMMVLGATTGVAALLL